MVVHSKGVISNYIGYLKRHHNIVYISLVILFLFQVISLISIKSEISGLSGYVSNSQERTLERIENNSKEYSEKLESFNNLTLYKFEVINKRLDEQQEAQNQIEKDVALIKKAGDFSDVAEEAIKGVVGIYTDKALGTGFIVHPSGVIVTNYHVIEYANEIYIETYDKEVYKAELMGEDRIRDIAILKVEGRRYTSLFLADSRELRVGQQVAAIGNPYGLSFSVSEGIISATGREGINGYKEYIQTDAPINPGNSGGPLIDKSGKVIGLNTFIVGGADGLGFALESNTVKEIVNKVLNYTLIE